LGNSCCFMFKLTGYFLGHFQFTNNACKRQSSFILFLAFPFGPFLGLPSFYLYYYIFLHIVFFPFKVLNFLNIVILNFVSNNSKICAISESDSNFCFISLDSFLPFSMFCNTWLKFSMMYWVIELS
jgi:hypothetical protein